MKYNRSHLVIIFQFDTTRYGSINSVRSGGAKNIKSTWATLVAIFYSSYFYMGMATSFPTLLDLCVCM